MKITAENGVVKVIRKRETAETIGRLFGWTNGDHK